MFINYRHNMMDIHSISAFARVRGGYNQGNRDVYFLRIIGGNDTLKNDIQDMDKMLDTAMHNQQVLYKRVHDLPLDIHEADRQYYLNSYEKWLETNGTSMQIHTENDNEAFQKALGSALKTVEMAYDKFKSGNSASIKRNFIMKLMIWTDFVMANNPIKWNERSSIKVIADNVMKVQEYLFYYMLTFLGADVMLLQTKQDIALPSWLEAYSKKMVLGEYGTWDIPAYVHTTTTQTAKSHVATANIQESESNHQNTVRIRIPERNRKTNTPKEQVPETKPSNQSIPERKEKSFEELARLASSIVMITIHDQSGKPVGSGSGIMIGKDGYILTNYHVVQRGYFYSVHIEEDDTVYKTDELIKYHSVDDLAIIRISRKLNPLPIYQGNTALVRGQKVVAIGSPLGLFNSVSDGIISGFRTIDTVDMMQFTAPTSHGSSGGAVLNMYGEVIGISTAGIDHAQNINLAVLYNNINIFVKGFC